MRNKRNLKEERGITLLALIITIIILVILALITVNSAYMSGIIQFGVNGAKDYAQATIEENRIMEETGKYVESVTKKIKVLLGEEPPTLPELEGMDWFVKGVTEPAEESKEVADFYAKGQPDGTLIIYPKNGIEATIEYVFPESYGCGTPRVLYPWIEYSYYDDDYSNKLWDQITSVYVAKGMKADTCTFLFAELPNCTKIDLTNLDTSQVSDMSYMFLMCESLVNLDLTSLNTSHVETMEAMFGDCGSLVNLDLTNLDTSQVTNVGFMFSGCSNLTSTMTLMNEPSEYSYMYERCSTADRFVIYIKLY